MKGLTGVIVSAGLTTGAWFGGNAINDHYKSPEYTRGRELDKVAKLIVNTDCAKLGDCGIEHYVLDDGRKVDVKTVNRTLSITIDGTVILESEQWDKFNFDGPDGDARNLQKVYMGGPNGMIELKRKDLPDAQEWQKGYEDILMQVAQKKRDYIEALKKSAEDTVLKSKRQVFGGEK
ncbi:MAG: hypothetical protein KKD18_00280 [Nanoarchaeota archaeon]|nr:hypothetical protein [Nanoarchaeota archaeon]